MYQNLKSKIADSFHNKVESVCTRLHKEIEAMKKEVLDYFEVVFHQNVEETSHYERDKLRAALEKFCTEAVAELNGSVREKLMLAIENSTGAPSHERCKYIREISAVDYRLSSTLEPDRKKVKVKREEDDSMISDVESNSEDHEGSDDELNMDFED